jgi:hypothetical protein
MRKRRISYVGALGLALAVAIPGSAMAGGTQTIEAGFLPQFNANIPQPPPTSNTGDQFSKAGTLYTRLFLANYSDPVPEAGIFDIHIAEEIKFNYKGMDQCDSDACTPVTLVSEMQNSPLPGFGTLSHTLVAQSAGGAVPDGIPIVDTSFTISKQFTDQQLARKAKKTKKKAKEASGSKARRLNKKARKLKQRSKKSYVQGRCTDGELITRNIVRYVDQSTQSDSVAQECT